MIDRPNQAWVADITYLPMARGFLYLVAIMDWHSRKVLAWRLSNTLTADFCVEALDEALRRFSVKYEGTYLRAYDTVADASSGLKRYIGFYNSIRRHQALGMKTPAEAYALAA